MLEKGSQTPVASIWKSDSTPFIPNPISEHLRNCGTGEQSDPILQTLAGRGGGGTGSCSTFQKPVRTQGSYQMSPRPLSPLPCLK